MNTIERNSLADYLATLDPMRTAALITGVFVGLAILYLLLHYLTRHGRARAREAARAWADVKRAEWSTRADIRSAHAREKATKGARTARRAHLALMAGAGGVVIVAIAATNLSAHGIQANLGEVGLGALDARVSVFIVFEGLLALAGGLSLWHQITGRTGIDRYAIGMWIISGLMSYLAAWGGGSPIFGVFPIIAAVAWHELTAAWAKYRGKYRGILGRGATSQDATSVDTERRINAIVTYGTRANVAPRGTRWFWAILHAWADRAADARGILTDEVRAMILARAAARYIGARALAPEAVAAHNPWNAAHARALTVPHDARALAPVPPAARTATPAPVTTAPVAEERASARVELRVVGAGQGLAAAEADALIEAHCKGGAEVRAWVREFWGRTQAWPTGRQLADRFGGDAGNCRKWVSDLKAATAGRVAA